MENGLRGKSKALEGNLAFAIAGISMPMEPYEGMLLVRLIPSTTGRDIEPGDLGRIDTYYDRFSYFHVQWQRTGLWSMMHPLDDGKRWRPLNPGEQVPAVL